MTARIVLSVAVALGVALWIAIGLVTGDVGLWFTIGVGALLAAAVARAVGAGDE